MNRLDMIAEVTSAAFTHYSDYSRLTCEVRAESGDAKVELAIAIEIPPDQMMTLSKVQEVCLQMASVALDNVGGRV